MKNTDDRWTHPRAPHYIVIMSNAPNTAISFAKMHGLGNDFVVIDLRDPSITISFTLDEAQARIIADRHLGIGCDQLIALEPPRDARAAAFMRIRNADGAEVEACGNAARCVAALLMGEGGQSRVTIETVDGLLQAREAGGRRVVVDMGPARLAWGEIPLASEMDTLHLPLAEGPVSDPCAVNIGNPHAVFFVADVSAIDVARIGPFLEHHPLYPNRTNVEFAQILGAAADGVPEIRMRVWERGVGITRACGTGACATAVAAARRGLAGRKSRIILDGGPLEVAWRDDGHVEMAGDTARVFAGSFDPRDLRPEPGPVPASAKAAGAKAAGAKAAGAKAAGAKAAGAKAKVAKAAGAKAKVAAHG